MAAQPRRAKDGRQRSIHQRSISSFLPVSRESLTLPTSPSFPGLFIMPIYLIYLPLYSDSLDRSLILLLARIWL